jgi:hypothetical protein
MPLVAGDRNVCAGPFGAVYDFYIERESVARIVGRFLWGIDVRPMYRSTHAIGKQANGATILDVPCGGGSRCGACGRASGLAT